MSQTSAKSAFSLAFCLRIEDDLHIDRQLAAAGLHEGFKGFDFHPKLALVVNGTASIDVVVALGRLKGRRLPFVERFSRLDVVVCIHEDGGLAGGVQPVGVDERVSLGRDDLDVLHADAAQFVCDIVGGLLDIRLVFFEGTDAGDAEKIFKFV